MGVPVLPPSRKIHSRLGNRVTFRRRPHSQMRRRAPHFEDAGAGRVENTDDFELRPAAPPACALLAFLWATLFFLRLQLT